LGLASSEVLKSNRFINAVRTGHQVLIMNSTVEFFYQAFNDFMYKKQQILGLLSMNFDHELTISEEIST
jgi:hypothetical protein